MVLGLHAGTVTSTPFGMPSRGCCTPAKLCNVPRLLCAKTSLASLLVPPGFERPLSGSGLLN